MGLGANAGQKSMQNSLELKGQFRDCGDFRHDLELLSSAMSSITGVEKCVWMKHLALTAIRVPHCGLQGLSSSSHNKVSVEHTSYLYSSDSRQLDSRKV